jgi:hypothetical protein
MANVTSRQKMTLFVFSSGSLSVGHCVSKTAWAAAAGHESFAGVVVLIFLLKEHLPKNNCYQTRLDPPFIIVPI